VTKRLIGKSETRSQFHRGDDDDDATFGRVVVIDGGGGQCGIILILFHEFRVYVSQLQRYRSERLFRLRRILIHGPAEPDLFQPGLITIISYGMISWRP
jgi:hypothetical protein